MQRLHGGGRAVLCLALGDQFIGEPDALPAMIAVHREVSTDQRGHAPPTELGKHGVHRQQRGFGAFWWHVAAVEKRMHVNSLGAALHRQPDHRVDVFLVTVHTTGRQQAEDVYRRIVAHSDIDGIRQRAV